MVSFLGHPSVISDKCPNLVYAQVGQENMELRCVVHANPRTDYIGWRVDASGEMVTTLNSKDGYSTSDQVSGFVNISIVNIQLRYITGIE